MVSRRRVAKKMSAMCVRDPAGPLSHLRLYEMNLHPPILTQTLLDAGDRSVPAHTLGQDALRVHAVRGEEAAHALRPPLAQYESRAVLVHADLVLCWCIGVLGG